ncbi:MAG TPA: serine/threonine-protein kinase [Bryobacteraceae bacterium]|nr:serine/threonine-protein kinase [Bryobacteraceae bacterium]
MPDAPTPPNIDPETTVVDTDVTPSRIIGPYHLLQCIGQGGMGEVWLAEQKHPLRRRVALKLIKAGMNTREIVARFESERQALALMDHPAIAKVFDAGSTPEGLPYFVMEYVAGVPITEYCDKHRLTMHDRLELFMQVCEGVQHAHQKAIIHRDLKPSNILITQVDDRPVPKIIDFGVAKATSQRLSAETMFTRVGALVGTPEYMSPEQVDSGGENIDTRTDVYSLGVVLYELLVGELPLDLTEIRNLAFHEVLRRIREDDAPRPSTKLRSSAAHSPITARNRRTEPADLGKQLKGDLDSIALKALEKERSRRYGSASDFAADIRRYLQNEPVKAVPPSLVYRSHKFVRRHRWGVAGSAILALAVLALIVSLIVGSARIARERDRANHEAQAAERVSDFLVQAFKVSDPDESRGNKITAREVLDNAARRIDTELANQPSLQARLMFTMGNVYAGLGLYEPAKQLLEKAIRIQQRVLGPDDGETLASQHLLARTLEYQAQYADAEKLYRDTVHRQERVLGPTNIQTLRTKSSLGMLYAEQGRYAEAEKLLTEMVEELTRVSGRNSPETLRTLHNLAIAYDGEHQYAKEAALWEEVYRVRSQKLGPDHPDTINSMQNLAYVYYRLGKNADAEKLQRQGLEIGRRVLGSDHPSVLLALGNLANTLLDEGKATEAESLQREALEGRRRMMGPNHPETQFAIANLANVLAAEKRYPEAERLYREALQGEIKALGDNHPEIANAWYNVATVEAAQGKRADALTDLHKAIDHGYRDPDEIAQAAGWKDMHEDAGYQQAFAVIKSRSVKK